MSASLGPGWVDALLVGVLLLMVAWNLSWTAGRLDRLHGRVEGSWAALDAQLVRRASVTAELATSGLLDPASSVLLAAAAHEARECEPGERELAESNLSAALRAAFDEEEAAELLTADAHGRTLLVELSSACQRVQLARRFHNGAVRSAQVVRRKRTVRWLRLSGHAAAPHTFEMDDAAPEAFNRGAGASATP
jgi:hypothetical protein